ncbi:hypothetical protein PG991_003386 [Apiospora marii]|uniref:Uncharacterized protein n=1 Tax=Apiospora marii TaxID=335849 RepID=A0ABR1S374_9PEZI
MPAEEDIRHAFYPGAALPTTVLDKTVVRDGHAGHNRLGFHRSSNAGSYGGCGFYQRRYPGAPLHTPAGRLARPDLAFQVHRRAALPPLAPWAIEDMEVTAKETLQNTNAQMISDHIDYYVHGTGDQLLSMTYAMAFYQSQSSQVRSPCSQHETFFYVEDIQVQAERRVLFDVLRLWVASRRLSKPQHVVGEETLGMTPQLLDPTRHDYGQIPVPPVISAQM